MKHALNEGADVTMLHIGRIGLKDEPGRYSVQFFRTLYQADRFPGTLRGEISAVPYDETVGLLWQVAARSRGEGPLRFVNGSDYPAVTPYLFVKHKTLKKLVKPGKGGPLSDGAYITEDQQAALDEIYRYNPLLFDFALKRTLVNNGVDIPREVFIGDL
jgi:mannonate dehydratase